MSVCVASRRQTKQKEDQQHLSREETERTKGETNGTPQNKHRCKGKGVGVRTNCPNSTCSRDTAAREPLAPKQHLNQKSTSTIQYIAFAKAASKQNSSPRLPTQSSKHKTGTDASNATQNELWAARSLTWPERLNCRMSSVALLALQQEPATLSPAS